MNTLKLDPAAMAAYTAIAETVSQELAQAATVAGDAVAPERLAGELGTVGAEFAARFTAAVAEHAQALSTAGQLVAAYGEVLRDYHQGMHGSDAATGAAIAKVGEVLA